MGIFSEIKSKTQGIVVDHKDFKSGAKNLPTNHYVCKINLAFFDKSSSGAYYVTLDLTVDFDGKARPYKERIYISNAAGEFERTNAQGEKVSNMGYALVDSICTVALNKPMDECLVETKSIKIYDFDKKMDVVADRDVLVDLKDKVINLIISEENQFKDKAKTGTVVRNAVSKVLFNDLRTICEVTGGIEKPEFCEDFLAKNKGQIVDKTKGAKGGTKAPEKETKSSSLIFN